MKLRERFSVSRRWQARISRVMQVLLLFMAVYGFTEGRTTVLANAFIGLLVTLLPPMLKRDHGIVMDPLLVLWITTAVFLHVAGSLGPYGTIWWWDHLTHALSSSVVAAAGYAGCRAVDEHSTDIQFPSEIVFVFILIFVMAFGVIWELLEFGLGLLSAAYGSVAILTQYGLSDTMNDLMFNLLGGIVVAVFGEAHLLGLTDELVSYLHRTR